MENFILSRSPFMSIGTSPKGNQEKWVSRGVFYKKDLFEGEAFVEYLISIFLESCEIPVDFVKYRMGDAPNICTSKSWVSDFRFVSFAKLLTKSLRKQPWFERVVKNKGNVYNYFEKNYWNRYSAKERYDFLKNLFMNYGVSSKRVDMYFTYLLEVDSLFFNIDRHFNNFGLIYNKRTQKYDIAPIFDNGFSLSVGYGTLRNANNNKGILPLDFFINERKVKMQPFSVDYYKNRKVVGGCDLKFNAIKFATLLYLTCPYSKTYLIKNRFYRIFRQRVISEIGFDKNGYDIEQVFKDNEI